MQVFEFLKPGIEELCSVLPPSLARRILAFAEQRDWLARFHWGMEVNTTSVSRLSALPHCWRSCAAGARARYRYAEEQRAIERWLGLIVRGGARSPPSSRSKSPNARA